MEKTLGGPLDLAMIRDRLNGESGQKYWRSLEELAETDSFRELLHREFPKHAGEWLDSMSRRNFLSLMGASLALAGVSACTRFPDEKILPYVQPPEQIIPGRPLFFATADVLGGFGRGTLVESHEGRPTKVEGNPKHPTAKGATDVYGQANILTMYDPDRSQTVLHLGDPSNWDSFAAQMSKELEARQGRQGAGIRVLTETITSPTQLRQFEALLKALPNVRWHQYEPVNRDSVYAGAKAAFGEQREVRYRFDLAKVILSLDSDFFSTEPGSLRYARDFAEARRVRKDKNSMSRFYAVESSPTITGMKADHRLPLKARDVEAFARALAAKLAAKGLAIPGWSEAAAAPMPAHDKWLTALADDLLQAKGAGLLLVGETQPAVVHQIVHALNAALENLGKTVELTKPVAGGSLDQGESFKQLLSDIEAGQVEVLLILGGNPVYTSPADQQFKSVFQKVGLRVHVGLYLDETAELCHWHVPASHTLEMWSDVRAYDGTASIIQPLIAPLYASKSAHDILALLSGQAGTSAYDLVRATWKGSLSDAEFEKSWRRWLHEGVIADSAFAPVEAKFTGAIPAFSAQEDKGFEILFRPDPSAWDGRFLNNGWLMELPRPLTKLVWDNAVLMSVKTAQKLGLSVGKLVSDSDTLNKLAETVNLTFKGRRITAPVWILPGHAEDSVTVHLGYGREKAGRVGNGVGFNAYGLRTSDAHSFGQGAEIQRTGETYKLVSTQDHHSLEGRGEEILRVEPITELRESFEKPKHISSELTIFPDWEYKGYAWGMSIDLNACTGCNACTAACVAENNIPLVGKDQVAMGRELHWIRLDRYFEGDLDNPSTYHQPMLCQQCERAPCELVCPVGATVHSDEGLNDMVYNRCLGTRYCSNNCPYKVRRFNFLQYSDWDTESLKLQRNPDVTVRSRGVMEKCTYCVQRINHARQDAKVQDRKVRDGDIVTACQQACPVDAIVFGDLNDPESRVSKLKAEPHDYSALQELNTKPRTTYLTRATNPNPNLGQGGAG